MRNNIAKYAFAVIELACGEYGEDKISTLIKGSQNGSNLQWFENSDLMDARSLRGRLKNRLTITYAMNCDGISIN